MGRPTVFNEQRGDAIIGAIERVGFNHIAAEINGVHRNTLATWLEKGEGPEAEEPFATFALRFREAKGKWQERKIGEVPDPRWVLERAEPGVFRLKDQVELSGNLALELAQLEGMSTQDIKQALREVLKEGETNDE